MRESSVPIGSGPPLRLRAPRMLKKRLIPTQLVEPAERPPVPIVDAPPNVRTRRRLVLRKGLRWVMTTLWLKLTRKYEPASAAKRLRVVLEEFGGLWVKIGQLLSLRTDMMPKEFCDELALLQHRSVGFPPAVARQIIERELGGPIEDYFSEFDDHPFAAASISQVHRGRLRRDDVEVAIKVQRPEIAAIFSRDIGLLRWMVGFMRAIHFMTFMGWDEMLWEVDQIMKEEVDYRYEAANIRRARKSFRKHKVYVPKVYEDYSTRSVLVMEYITGTLMSDFIAMRGSDPERLQNWLDENDVVPSTVGRRLLFAFLQELLEDNLFHGDLHPGNIILLRNSRFAMIDLGSVGSLEKAGLDHYMQSFRALATRDYDKAVDMMFLLSPRLPPTIDLAEVKQKMVRAYRAWDARVHLQSLPYHEKSLNSLGQDTTDIMYAYEIPFSWSFMKVGRTWATLDASLNFLIPDANYTKLFKRFFEKAQARGVKKALKVSTLVAGVSGALEKAAEYSGMLGPIVRRQSLIFRGLPSKIAYLWTTIFRLLKFAVFAGGVVLLYDFLTMHKPEWVAGIEERFLQDAAKAIPSYSVAAGFGLIALLIYLHRLLERLRQRFSEQEVSNTSGSVGGR